MIIKSEQEMLAFGKRFAKYFNDSTTTWTGDSSGRGPQNVLRSKNIGEGEELAGPIQNEATVIELLGDVGAGKTTFVRGLAQDLGIKDPVNTPSFTISKSYALPGGGNLIHYDFYRLQDPGLMSEDLQENLQNPHNIIVIEWGASIENLLPADHFTIKIDYNNDNTRSITI